MRFNGLSTYHTERVFDLWHMFARYTPRAVGAPEARAEIEAELARRGLSVAYNDEQNYYYLAQGA